MLPVGNYIIHAMSNDGHERVMQARLPIHVASDVNGLVLTLEQSIQIPVVVRKDLIKPELMQADLQAARQRRPVAASVQLTSISDGETRALGLTEGRTGTERPKRVGRKLRCGRDADGAVVCGFCAVWQ